MAVLVIDVGNTRWKYALIADADARVSAPLALDAPTDQAKLAELASVVAAKSLDWIAVSCVGNRQAVKAIQAWAAEFGGAKVFVASVSGQWDGFNIGYENPARLGVDRWLAMLAVRARLSAGEQALVADCGTAITLEKMNIAEHLGGQIAPGLRLMGGALNAETADLPLLQSKTYLGQEQWANNTEQAIAAGCLSAAVGLLYRQEQLAEDRTILYITGGDAELISRQLPNWVVDGTLVLEGLRLWGSREISP